MPYHFRGGVPFFFCPAQQFPPAFVRHGQLGALPMHRRLPI
jgi:hypothetical protein